MTNIASVLDMALYLLVAATAGLIVFKTVELGWPHRFGHPNARRGSGGLSELELLKLERGLTTLGVISSNAAFLGLAGTVAHIMTALQGLKGGLADGAVISGPIATSLTATLLGLAAAIPAAVAHQYLQRRIAQLEIMAESTSGGAEAESENEKAALSD